MSVTTHPVTLEQPRPSALRRARPFAEATLFVALWMALAPVVSRDVNLYLLLGVPLTGAFQLLVRRRPLRELWVRDAPPFRLDAGGWAIAAALTVLPGIRLVQFVVAREWVAAGWTLAAVLGAIAGAYALRRFRRRDARLWLHWVATATVAGVLVLAASLVPAVVASGPPQPLAMLLAGLESAILYVPVQFLLEEVTFRGALDTHVDWPGARRPWVSALVVSALWGLWHVPITPAGVPLAVAVGSALLVHCAVGVPLSLGWRRTGNLFVPVLAHALIDGVRNGLMAGL